MRLDARRHEFSVVQSLPATLVVHPGDARIASPEQRSETHTKRRDRAKQTAHGILLRLLKALTELVRSAETVHPTRSTRLGKLARKTLRDLQFNWVNMMRS